MQNRYLIKNNKLVDINIKTKNRVKIYYTYNQPRFVQPKAMVILKEEAVKVLKAIKE